ncbi:uncharacterized protein ACNS7B_012127 [Menidia menidia]
MCEATADLDVEEMKAEATSELLPEPLLLILSPPPPFLPAPGEPAMLWPKWLNAFEHYLQALGEKELADSSRLALLRNCLGPEGERVMAALIRNRATYAAAVSDLTAHFSSDPASQGHRLTLGAALAVGKEVERVLNKPRFDIHEVVVDIGDDLEPPVQRKAKRGRPRRGERRPQTKPSAPKPQTKSLRRKDEYYFSNDELYYSDSRGDAPQAADQARPAQRNAAHHDPGASGAEEEGSCNGVEDKGREDHEDGDFVLSSDKRKATCCPLCVNRRFRDAHKLARHMRTHTKDKPFSCPVCKLTFSQSYHMTRHMRSQHAAGQHVCSTCGQSLAGSAELQEHKKTHRSQPLRCPECGQNFTHGQEFSEHVRSHQAERHSSEPGGGAEVQPQAGAVSAGPDARPGPDREQEGPGAAPTDNDASQDREKATPPSESQTEGHFCPICVDRRFRGPNKLARHMRTHTKEKPFSCPVCAMPFSQSYHMTRHVRNQHGLGQHVCSKCGRSFGTWLDLKAHRKTHAVEGLTCLACDKQFKEKAALARHLKLHRKVEASPRSLSCSDCGKAFGRMYHLKRHIMTHRKGATAECYACPDCPKSFAFPEDLNKHLQVHVKESSGTCSKCNQSFGSAEELETHMLLHQKSFACATCGKKFKVEYALKKHEQSHGSEPYYCSRCRKRFPKLSLYKRHVLVHDRREAKCPHCERVFLQLTALKYHLRTHTEQRPHQCSCCIESFPERAELERHSLRHRKLKRERPYSCTRCDRAFPSLLELTQHMGSHRGEQPHACTVCGRTFLNKSKLERHVSIHTGERPHLCSVCGNGFPSAASLKLHLHIHSGEKPFRCAQCGKSFRSASGLRLHGRQHLEERPSYECPQCGRTYGRMTELKMHQRYHTGDKPYVCTYCGKRFISKDKLNVHMRTHTGERPYSCPHCGQTFTQTGDRNRHISKYHPPE